MRLLTLLFLSLVGIPTEYGTSYRFACVRAQTISGRVTDANTGEALAYASIYVPATKGGTATNADGYFRVDLGGGQQILVSYLGYQTVTKRVIGGQADVQLVPESLDLEQVEIISDGEDKGYPVIRRAIAKADYHRNQLDGYTAEVYLKGTGKVTQIPGVVKLFTSKEDREEIDENLNKAFTTESTSRVEYERPNTYREQVLSKLEVGDTGFDANQYIFTSFYDPLVANTIVSPLNPRAFAYYKFEHQGASVDNDELVHKIRVIPRSRGEDVFEGYVYIVQGDWSLHSLDLTTYKTGFEINIRQSYAEVEDHVWMPISLNLRANGKVFGVGIDYKYLSTTSDYVLQLNPELGGYVEVIDEKSQPETAATTRKARKLTDLEQRLNDGGEIRARDLRKLMRNYEKEERTESDAPEVVRDYTYVRDTTVEVITDTAAWAAIRPVPLTVEEKEAYVRADSIARVDEEEKEKDTTVSADGADRTVTITTNSQLARALFGGGGKFQKSILPEPFFTPVEGYALGAGMSLTHREKQYGLGLTPRYGFAWKRLTWRGELFTGLSGEAEEKKWRLSGGRFLRQFNDQPAIDPWISTFANLMSGRNFIRLYERAYGQLDYRNNYGDAFRIGFTATYEDRRAVSNNSNQNWRGLEDEETYAANLPINPAVNPEDPFRLNPAATYRAFARWRPGLKYLVQDGERQLIEDSAPTLTAEIRGGIPEIGGSTADFFRAEASYQRNFSVGRKAQIKLLAVAGAFVRAENVAFPDYKHFNASEFVFTATDPIRNYRLLTYYGESTNEEYAQVFAHYQFRKFLLTQILPLHLKGLKEDLFVNYLYTPTSQNYTEVGYSLDNIFRFLRVEFVTAFRDFSYDDFGVRISLSSSFSSLVF